LSKGVFSDKICSQIAFKPALYILPAAQCQWFIGGCQGAAPNNCYPYGLWSSSKGSEAGSYTNRELNGGAYANTYTRSVANAFGVRCVLDLI